MAGSLRRFATWREGASARLWRAEASERMRFDSSPAPGDAGHPAPHSVSATDGGWLAEMTPVSGNDEKHASDGECNACDDRSRSRHLECWELSGDEPDTCKQDQQEADLGQCDARLMAQRKHRNDGSYSDRSALPATERELLGFQDHLQRSAGCRTPDGQGHVHSDWRPVLIVRHHPSSRSMSHPGLATSAPNASARCLSARSADTSVT